MNPTPGLEPLPEVNIRKGMERIHDRIRDFFEDVDGAGRFQEDPWLRPGGGAGITRVMTLGRVFEKVGVNRSAVDGALPPELARSLLREDATGQPVNFFATGVSVVAHPESPRVPIVHLNVRYFELRDVEGRALDAWFGGGIDLTPTFPYPEDAAVFHRTLKALCDRFDGTYYPGFKRWCDEYFVNSHRDDEMRGVGGIFFDHLRPGPDGDPWILWKFVQGVGNVLETAYGPIARRRCGEAYTEEEKHFQLVRRGRYAEFNLVHDRGTRFGLLSQARTESVLMSLPPMVHWGYGYSWAEGSFQNRLLSMLRPRDWASEPAEEAWGAGEERLPTVARA